MTEPTIDVVLMTWPNHPKRIEYFRRTLTGLRANLTASRHRLNYLVSSESERDPDSTWHGNELAEICEAEFMPLFFRDGPASLGAGMNAALRLCTSPTIFLVQDDYELLYPLDISPGADLLEKHHDIDIIRYSYYTHPQNGTRFLGALEEDGFRTVDIYGPWPYGDDPHMRTPRTVERHGFYREGIGHGSEGDMVHRLVAGRAKIVAYDRCYFGNFGEVSAVPNAQEYRERAQKR
jgi:hypothetical protein